MTILRSLISFAALLSIMGCVQAPAPVQPAPISTAPPAHTLSPAPTLSPTPSPFIPIPGYKPIRLAWFYKPPAALDRLLPAFNQFILTHNDETARDELKLRGAVGPILQYLLLNEIQDPGSCTDRPYQDQVAYQPGDFCWIQRSHPDWFLRDLAGKPIGSGRYFIMDAGNPAWRAIWLERARAIQEGMNWEGVFLDNVEASRSKIMEWGLRPAAYPDDSSYTAAIQAFLKELYLGYFKPHGRPLYANIIAVQNPDVWLSYMQYLDGAMLENFAVGWPQENGLTPAAWETQMEMLSRTQAMGKSLILVAQGNRENRQREEFALASYLLINDGLAVFRYTHNEHYEEIWLYDNYSLDIGQPMGPRYQENGVWKRRYTRGSVELDPVQRTAAIHVQQ